MRDLRETNLICAKREFEEETGLTKYDYEIKENIDCIDELFLGTNNIRYKHIYYIAEAKDHIDDYKFIIDKSKLHQVSEISYIKWFLFTDALNKIRNYNVEKKNALERLHNILIKTT